MSPWTPVGAFNDHSTHQGVEHGSLQMWGYGVSRPNQEGPLPSGGPALLSFISIRGLSPGPLFIWEDGSPLTRAAMVKEIQSALASVDIDPTPYSGHSFRIGRQRQQQQPELKTRWDGGRALHTSVILGFPKCPSQHRHPPELVKHAYFIVV